MAFSDQVNYMDICEGQPYALNVYDQKVNFVEDDDKKI